MRIESIAAGGEGVGRLEDGRVAFVHRTAPGDLIRASLTEQRKRWTRGRLEAVVEASPDRRDAPCPFYGECGGCTLEHMTYPAQLRSKARIVGDALVRIGGFEMAAPEVVASPREHRYRNRVSFALRREGSGRVRAGFHALGEPGRIVEVDGRCLLPEEPIARGWDALRAAWGNGASRLPSGEALRLTLRSTAAGELTLLVEGGFAPGDPVGLLERVPGLAAIWHRPGGAPAALVAGTPGLPESWGDERVELSGTSFLQVNREAAALLEAHVMELLGTVEGLRVIDAYCGVGLHARRLARAGARVVGIEMDADAIEQAKRGNVDGAEFIAGAVESLLSEQLPADRAILNPPRAGVAPEVVDALLARPVERLIYVSCDPATLARDLRRLSTGYALEGVRSFDLFPQTAHVETVAALRTLGELKH